MDKKKLGVEGGRMGLGGEEGEGRGGGGIVKLSFTFSKNLGGAV